MPEFRQNRRAMIKKHCLGTQRTAVKAGDLEPGAHGISLRRRRMDADQSHLSDPQRCAYESGKRPKTRAGIRSAMQAAGQCVPDLHPGAGRPYWSDRYWRMLFSSLKKDRPRALFASGI